MILLLDVMDTLVRDPFHAEVPAFFGLELPALLAAKDPEAWQRFERGEWDEETFAAGYFRDRRPVDKAGFQAALRAGYRWLPGIEPLLAELRAAGAPMHVLSNYPPWYRLIEEELGLSRYLPWSFVSCETGARKPEPAAYLGAAARLGVAPADCLLVDDRQANVAGALAVGMPALRFRDAETLRAELVRRGALSGPPPRQERP
ncbi:MAG: HAD family hydrolase [Planctomycetota bacterium]